MTICRNIVAPCIFIGKTKVNKSENIVRKNTPTFQLQRGFERARNVIFVSFSSTPVHAPRIHSPRELFMISLDAKNHAILSIISSNSREKKPRLAEIENWFESYLGRDSRGRS